MRPLRVVKMNIWGNVERMHEKRAGGNENEYSKGEVDNVNEEKCENYRTWLSGWRNEKGRLQNYTFIAINSLEKSITSTLWTLFVRWWWLENWVTEYCQFQHRYHSECEHSRSISKRLPSSKYPRGESFLTLISKVIGSHSGYFETHFNGDNERGLDGEGSVDTDTKLNLLNKSHSF